VAGRRFLRCLLHHCHALRIGDERFAAPARPVRSDPGHAQRGKPVAPPRRLLPRHAQLRANLLIGVTGRSQQHYP